MLAAWVVAAVVAVPWWLEEAACCERDWTLRPSEETIHCCCWTGGAILPPAIIGCWTPTRLIAVFFDCMDSFVGCVCAGLY